MRPCVYYRTAKRGQATLFRAVNDLLSGLIRHWQAVKMELLDGVAEGVGRCMKLTSGDTDGLLTAPAADLTLYHTSASSVAPSLPAGVGQHEKVARPVYVL